MAITLRPMRPGDLDFARQVYASTRADELAVLIDWTAQQKADFLDMQFEAQHTYYQQVFADAAYLIIMQGKRRIGRLYLDRRPDEIRVIDIALLPAFRGRGIGSRLMGDILAEGRRESLPVRIHVERNNPAMRLYRRLGFRPVDEHGIYYLMEWRSEDDGSPDEAPAD
jgi:ribosomal protein S18 acetylase RimI-like enzyme